MDSKISRISRYLGPPHIYQNTSKIQGNLDGHIYVTVAAQSRLEPPVFEGSFQVLGFMLDNIE